MIPMCLGKKRLLYTFSFDSLTQKCKLIINTLKKSKSQGTALLPVSNYLTHAANLHCKAQFWTQVFLSTVCVMYSKSGKLHRQIEWQYE